MTNSIGIDKDFEDRIFNRIIDDHEIEMNHGQKEKVLKNASEYVEHISDLVNKSSAINKEKFYRSKVYRDSVIYDIDTVISKDATLDFSDEERFVEMHNRISDDLAHALNLHDDYEIDYNSVFSVMTMFTDEFAHVSRSSAS